MVRSARAAGPQRDDRGPYTVGLALDDYVADYKRRGGKAVDRLEAAIRAHLRPTLGSGALQSLTHHQVERWHTKLAEAPPRLRTAPGKRQQYADLDTSADGLRRRRSTANRVLT